MTYDDICRRVGRLWLDWDSLREALERSRESEERAKRERDQALGLLGEDPVHEDDGR